MVLSFHTRARACELELDIRARSSGGVEGYAFVSGWRWGIQVSEWISLEGEGKVNNVGRIALESVGRFRARVREGAHSEYPLARLMFCRAASCTVSAVYLWEWRNESWHSGGQSRCASRDVSSDLIHGADG